MTLRSDLSPPKLCNLVKWSTFQGYGFNLHAEKGKAGQFIGKVDPGSPADLGGLKPKDILIEVNSINVENFKHQQVVECVKSRPDSVSLLVCCAETLNYCRENQIQINANMPDLVEISTPDMQPTDNIDAVQKNGENAVSAGTNENQQLQPQQEQNQDRQHEEKQRQNLSDSEPYLERDQVALNQVDNRTQVLQNSIPVHKQQNDPLANISLAEMRAKIGQNRRNQIKMNSSTFTEKHQAFQSL